MNKTNMRLLANWLMTNEKHLVETNGFNMGYFRSDQNQKMEDFVSPEQCGTAGCALGWGPATGVPALAAIEADFYTAEEGFVKTLDYDRYCRRVMQIDTNKIDTPDDAQWVWCFDEGWTPIDNTPRGAAIRIFYLLDHGDEVSDWSVNSQRMGTYSNSLVERYNQWWDAEGKQKW